MVIFTKLNHQYHYNDGVYKSVSSLFKPYESFDSEAESLRMALKHIDPEWYGELSKKYGYKSPEIFTTMLCAYDREEIEDIRLLILADWKERGETAGTKGTAFHSTMEDFDIQRGGRINPYSGEWFPHADIRIPGYDNNSVEYLTDLENGYYPELLLFNHDHKLAGQADMVFIKDGKVWIDDWKTDKKIETKSFYTKRYGYTFLKPPLQDIHDSNFWRYALKISTYGWMLEDAGFEVMETGFTHVGGGAEGGDYLYRTPYMRDEVLKILNQTS